MARISLVGDGHISPDYLTGDLWWSAESAIDYGSQIEAVTSGDCGSLDASGGSVNGYSINSDGIEYDGANHLSLPLFERLYLNSDDGTAINFRVLQSSIFTSVVVGGNNTLADKFHVSFGSGASGFALSMLASATNRNASRFVLDCNNTSRAQAVQTGFNRVFSATNYIIFGAEIGCPGSAGNQEYINGFSFNNSNIDYEADAELTNAASEDATGTVGLTGYTSAELVNFASGDYRTKSTSPLATAGTGGTFIGAFLETTTGGVTGDIAFNVSAPSFSASGSATVPQPSGNIAFSVSAPTFNSTGSATLPQPSGSVAFNIDAPSFSATGSASLPNPTGTIGFTIGSPSFSSTGSVTLPQPSGDISFSVSAPTFNGTGGASFPYPQGIVAFDISSPTFSGTGTATQPNPTGNASFTIDSPVFTSTGSATLPNPSGSIDFTINGPTFSATGEVSIPYPVGNVSFDIGAPSFSGTGSVTLPNPSGVITYTISAPQFSATGSVSGLVIPLGDILTLTSASNVITLPYTSNTIKL